MLDKIKSNKYKIIEVLTIFTITLIYNLICNDISNDEIWNYGFSYNIAQGLIPYKDFNMVITPLFPILGAIFLNIFGKNLLVFHIFNSIICTAIFHFMKKNIPKSYYIVYAIFLIYSLPNYNVFCILLLYILQTLEDKKYNDFIIGIFLGLTFLTKQNIGIYLCIPSLFTKDIRKILKRILGFVIPNILMLIYLFVNKNLYEFIDYIFLGIGSFAKENFIYDITSIALVIITSTYLIYKYLKTKDIKLVYLFCFQLLVFPLIEPYHVMISIIPTIGYFISTLKLNKKIITLAFTLFITINFSINLYGIYKEEYTFPNITNEYKYRKILKNDDIAIKNITHYIKNVDDKLYIICGNAYLFKLEANIPINKYDLLNNGNLGKKGEQKLINELEISCSKEKCTFIIGIDELRDSPEIQYNKEIINYILNNYHEVDQLYKHLIYKN